MEEFNMLKEEEEERRNKEKKKKQRGRWDLQPKEAGTSSQGRLEPPAIGGRYL
jgi:hypothetical protein